MANLVRGDIFGVDIIKALGLPESAGDTINEININIKAGDLAVVTIKSWVEGNAADKIVKTVQRYHLVKEGEGG